MTNPSTLARQKFYTIPGTPTFFIDGYDSDSGGGAATDARSIFDRKVDPKVQEHLKAAPEAKIDLRATRTRNVIKVKTKVSRVTSTSDKLRLHIVLAEDMVRYSGENGLRFHEMVVRSVAAPPASAAAKQPAPAADAKPAQAAKPAAIEQGFPVIAAKGGSFEYTFDLAKAVADAKAHLEDYETNTRKGQYSFHPKKHEITGQLSVVAFVQNETTKKVLQAVYVKAASGKPTT